MHLSNPSIPAQTAPAVEREQDRDTLTFFVVKRGMLRVGLTLFVVSTLYIYAVLHVRDVLTFTWLARSGPICIVLGGLWGVPEWLRARTRRRALQ